MAQLEEWGSSHYPVSKVLADDDVIIYVRRKLLAWGRERFEDFPWRGSTNEFHTLIAEILLQRTRATQVVPVYLDFVDKYPDAASLSKATIREIEDIILPLGLRWRAKLLIRLGKSLKRLNWEVPDDQQLLIHLPGVGAYISAAYLSLHRGRRAPIIDSNIVRFYGRFFGFNTGPETRREQALIKLADRITPKSKFKAFNYALIDFTRNICRPRPEHTTCPVKAKCFLWTVVNQRNGRLFESNIFR